MSAPAVLPEPAPDTRARSLTLVRTAAAIAGVAAAIVALYSPVVFGGKTFVLRDALRFTLPCREFLGRSLAHGRIPEWWDGVGFGVAFAANPAHGVTSPLTWLMALGASSTTSDRITVLQIMVFAAGTILLLRQLGATLAGAVFSAATLTTSGYVVSTIPNGNTPYVCWIPWVLWSALIASDVRDRTNERTRLLLSCAFAIALALQFLAGEPTHALVALLLVGIFVVASGDGLRRIRRLLIPGIAGVLLAAPSVLPAMFLLQTSARGAASAGGPVKWSMPPGRVLEWIWPLPFGSEGGESWFIGSVLPIPPGDPCFVLSLYVGIPVLVLGLVAAVHDRRSRRLVLVSPVFLLLALGSSTPLYALLRASFVPLRVANYPEKFFFGALLLWCAAAGSGFSELLSGRKLSWWWQTSAAMVALLLGAAAIAVRRNEAALAARLGPHAAGTDLTGGLEVSAWGAAVAAIGAAVFAVALFVGRRGNRRGSLALVFVGALVPLAFAAWEITPLADRESAERTPRILVGLPRSPQALDDIPPRLFVDPGPRIRPPLKTGAEIAADIHEILDTNVAARFGYDVVPGFVSVDSVQARRFWEGLVSSRMSFLGFTRLLGVDYAMMPDPDRSAPGFPVLARNSSWGIVGTFPVRPRAFVAPRATPVGSADEGVESLTWAGREGDPARVVVSGPGSESLEVRGPLEPCLVRSPRPEEVLLTCQSPNGGYAVVLDENLPGWSAELDGRPAPILAADGLFRAVRVGPGEHRVSFRYRTPGLRGGVAISALMLVTVAVVAGRRGRRGPNEPRGREAGSPEP